MFNKSLKKYCSFIILAIFLIVNNLYALPGSIGKDKLRVPLIFSGSNRVNVLDVNTVDSYSRYYADIKLEQDKLQKQEEARAAELHKSLADDAKAGKIDMTGAISAEEIDKIKKLINLWVNTERYSQIVFISSEGHVLADAFLQALTATSDWNEELYKKKRPQVFFVDPLDSTDINRLVNSLSRPFSSNEVNKVLLVSTVSGVNRTGDIEIALTDAYASRVNVSKSDIKMDSAVTSLLLAGIVSENYVDDIYKGAKSAYDEWLDIKSQEEAAGYAAYKLASTQIRFAKTGQNISVFMMFSKRLKGFSVWLAQQFNREVGNSKLNILFSGEWSSDHRHSTSQAHVQARGFGYSASLDSAENHGFITFTYLIPEADDKKAVVVTGDANPRHIGYHVNFLRDVDREAQRLACQQADRPIVDVNFSARTPEDLGRFLHFGQVSALMAGRLAGSSGGENLLEQKIDDRMKMLSSAIPMKDGEIEIAQNILFLKDDGKFGGILGEKIQKELDDPKIKEKKMFNLVVKQMARLVGPKGGLDKVIKSVQSGHALVHLDPEQTRKAVDVSEAMAKRFLAGSDTESEVFVAAIGGSVSGDYLMRTLDLKDGPKVTFITDYDEERLGIILEKIRKSPEKIRIVIISKSGVTTEVDVNGMAMMDALKKALRAKGVSENDIKEHFLFITDPKLGDLREKVRNEGYISLDHPAHGGRFTILTELGLFFYFLKGGDKKGLLEALDNWGNNTKTLNSISKEIMPYKDALEKKDKKLKQRIEAIKNIFDILKKDPAVMSGFLRTLINTIQQTNPEEMRDTLVGIAVNGNTGQIINPGSPLFQQINTESMGKPGVRIYTVGACGLAGIESLWDRILSNGRIFVELYGEQRNDTTADDARRLQATWEILSEELTNHGVPVISVKTGNMGINSLVGIMRMIYLELAVSAEMYTPMAISSEGQPGVELAKAIGGALMAEVNAGTGHDYSLKERGPRIPRIPHDKIESIIEVPMNIEHSMSLASNHSLAALAEKIINSSDASNPGLMTIKTRRQIELMDKNKIVEYVRNKLERLITGEPGVNLVIIDGEAKAGTDKTGGYIVRATSIESVSNLVTGTVTGTSVDFYKRYDSGIKLELTIHFFWGSGSVRAIVSNGLRTQDFILLDEGKIVEASKAGEHNYMQMAGVGDHISFGGPSTGRPEGFQAFEMEVVLESMDFKIRHEDSVTPDMYMMMNKQGVMTGWMTWGEAFGVAYIMGAAGGNAMMMTEKGMTHIKDIKITEEMLRSKEKIYVYAGVKNLIQQIQIWMDFLNARSQEGLTGQPVIFRLLDVIGAMPQDVPVLVKANAIMFLLRIKEGLDALPKKTLKSRVKDTVSGLEYKVSEALAKLDTERIIYELKQEYIGMGLEQRKANRDRFVLLGQRDALMRSEVKAGDETIELYELESMFGRIKSWQIMEGILQGLGNDGEAFKRIMRELQMSYERNAHVTAESKTVSLPQSEPGEEFNNYLRDNLRVSKDAIIEPGAVGQVLEQTRQVSESIMNIYMNPVEIKSDMQADDVQKDIIAELRAREPEVFYIEDGKEYIRSLRWIMRNIHERKTGAVVNISGDVSSRLDFIFNAIFKYALRQHIYVIVSEEDSLIVYGVGANKTKDVNSYRIVLFLDPIDGSSQIKDEGNFGSIFTLGFLRPGQSLEDGTFDARRQVLLDFDLQYGETTQLIVHNPANKDGEDELVEFALHDSLDNGPVFREELRYKNTTDIELQNLKWEGLLPLPDRENSDTAIHLALGGSLMTDLPEDGDKSMTKWLVKTYGYKQQYTGGLINDIRKIFSGHFVNPNRAGFIHKYGRTGAHREGRLRTSFEGFHNALMAKSIGAEVTNERQPLLNIRIEGDSPSKIKCAHYAGSAWIMKLFMSWHDYWNIYRTKNNGSSISDEVMDKTFEEFMKFYSTNADRLIKEIMEYSNSGAQGTAQKSEMDVRKALLLWDSVDMEENYFPRFLKMTGDQAYKKLFPETSTLGINNLAISVRGGNI